MIDYDDRSYKLLHENRDIYTVMSELARDGHIPTYAEARAELERRAAAHEAG